MAGEAKEHQTMCGGMLSPCSVNVKNTRETEGLQVSARVEKRPRHRCPGRVKYTYPYHRGIFFAPISYTLGQKCPNIVTIEQLHERIR